MKLFSLLLLLPASVFIPKFLIHTWKEMPRRGAVGDLRFKKRDSTRLFLLQPQPLLSSFARAPKKTSRALARLVCAVQVTVVENQRNRRQPNQQARKRERELPSLPLSLSLSLPRHVQKLYTCQFNFPPSLPLCLFAPIFIPPPITTEYVGELERLKQKKIDKKI